MADVTVKGIPDGLHRRLKEEAEANRRSLNREIIHRLERSVAAPAVDPDAYLAGLAAVRERAAPSTPLTDRILREARDEGRP